LQNFSRVYVLLDLYTFSIVLLLIDRIKISKLKTGSLRPIGTGGEN